MSWSPVVRQWAVLRAHPDFGKLFTGTTVSSFGSAVSGVALPLTAVVFLDATPAQMGILGALAFVPYLVLGLPAGVWLERAPYRTVLVLCDLSRAVLLGAVPVLAAFGVLAMWQLYVLMLLAGVGTLFDSLASMTYVPALVPRAQLLHANSALAQSNAVVGASGSAVGGALVQLLTAPIAVIVDAASFLVSAVCKALIRQPGKLEVATHPRDGLWRGIAAGLKTVVGHRILRPMIIAATLGALAGQLQAVVVMLFLVDELRLRPSVIGFLVAAGGVAAVAGALVAAPITERLGHGPAFLAGTLSASVAGFVLAAAGGPLPLVLVAVAASQVLVGAGPPLYSVIQSTVRQALSPPELLARVNATWRFLVFGAQSVGALLGGALGSTVGLRATIVVGSAGMLLAVAIAAASPLRRLHRLAD